MRQSLETARRWTGAGLRLFLLRLCLAVAFALALCVLFCLFPQRAHAAEPAGPAAPSYSREEQRLWEAYQDGTLIRLHILAQDDSPQAQALKLQVRDAVLAAFSQSLSAQDPDALYLLLQENVQAMRQVAEETARAAGFAGSVTAQVGVMTLPAKRYGQVLLPQGEYRALRIALGEGEGQNWWCVLFPSLCLAVADEEPWKTPAPRQGEGGGQSPSGQSGGQPSESSELMVVWDSQRIFREWLCLPQGL